jgi:hypothetical protein
VSSKVCEHLASRRDQGKVRQAHELLAPVYGWFTEGFDTRDLKMCGCQAARTESNTFVVKSCGLEGREQEFLDSLHVMEVSMQHFLAKAIHAKTNNGKLETIDANMLQAVSIAEKIAPNRHHGLAAIKLNKDPIDTGGLRRGSRRAI